MYKIVFCFIELMCFLLENSIDQVLLRDLLDSLV